MIDQNELCLQIAVSAHKGQTRRGGEPYINHPVRVAESFPEGSLERSIAYLHDVLEDCEGYTGMKLWKAGVLPVVIDAVTLLTKAHGDYEMYLEGLSSSHRARKVKIADMLDNLTDSPTDNLTPKQVEKYKKGILYLV